MLNSARKKSMFDIACPPLKIFITFHVLNITQSETSPSSETNQSVSRSRSSPDNLLLDTLNHSGLLLESQTSTPTEVGVFASHGDLAFCYSSLIGTASHWERNVDVSNFTAPYRAQR